MIPPRQSIMELVLHSNFPGRATAGNVTAYKKKIPKSRKRSDGGPSLYMMIILNMISFSPPKYSVPNSSHLPCIVASWNCPGKLNSNSRRGFGDISL